MNTNEWMGRYRLLVHELNRHANQNIRFLSDKRAKGKGNFQEWQVLEYIVEHSEEMNNMHAPADALCISKASLTKYVQTLCTLGYVKKYKSTDNKKNIILRATEEGVCFYKQIVEQIMFPHFEPFFSELNDIPDVYLEKIANALRHHNQRRTYKPDIKLNPIDDDEEGSDE